MAVLILFGSIVLGVVIICAPFYTNIFMRLDGAAEFFTVMGCFVLGFVVICIGVGYYDAYEKENTAQYLIDHECKPTGSVSHYERTEYMLVGKVQVPHQVQYTDVAYACDNGLFIVTK